MANTMTKKISLKAIMLLVLILILIVPSSYLNDVQQSHSYFFYCKVDTVYNQGDGCINISWNELNQQIGDMDPSSIQIRNLSNNRNLSPEIIDSNGDNKADYLALKLEYTIDDPLRAVEIYSDNNHLSDIVLKNETGCKSDLIATKIIPATLINQNDMPISWADTIAVSIMKTYPNVSELEIYSPGQWTYTNGFFINALCELYKKTNNNKYKDYAQQWLNSFVNNSGVIDTNKYDYRKFELDDILPGRSLIYMYQFTGDEKYKKAADQLMNQLKIQPETSDGGFWHKKVYKQQMWLDGIYMGDVFLAQYGNNFNKSEYIQKSIQQFLLIYSHTLDPKAGLLYHGWDESKNKVWADSVNGTSPEFWGRSIGWYMMALVDILDYIPETNPDRKSILKILESLSTSLLKYQDTNGLWYQVIDKGNISGNWHETSCSAMIAYAYAKGSKKGYLNPDFMNNARKAFDGLKKEHIFFDREGKVYLSGTVKVGTLNTKYSDGSYSYYVSVERRLNDFKGFAALLYLSMYLDEI